MSEVYSYSVSETREVAKMAKVQSESGSVGRPRYQGPEEDLSGSLFFVELANYWNNDGFHLQG